MAKNLKYLVMASLLAAIMMCCNSHNARAQQLAIKTNALSFAAGTPTIGLEGVVGEKLSLGVSFMGHYKPYGFRSKFLACSPELRYWFAGRALTREFIGVTVSAAAYNSTIKNYVYDGYSLVVGLTGGYAFNIGKRWNLELSAGLGVAGYMHKRYGVNDHYEAYRGGEAGKMNSWGYKLIPVGLGVTFTYIIM